ncbi:MAG TPA: hypothetical protein VIP55_05505, partial [Agromyces sp.]
MGVEPGAAETREERDGEASVHEELDAHDHVDVHDAPIEVRRGTRLDDWWARVLSTPGRRLLWYWGGPI